MLPGMPKVAQTKNAWNVKRRMLTKFHSAVMGLLRSERMKNGEIFPVFCAFMNEYFEVLALQHTSGPKILSFTLSFAI